MKISREQAGQSLLEFGLVIPFILALVIGFTELGRVVYFYSAVNNAVREGARFGSVTQFASDAERDLEIQQKVVDYSIIAPMDLSDVTQYCDLDVTDQDNPCDDYITVTATFTVEPIVPLLTEIIGIGSEYTITAESSMQMTPYGSIHE
jgi:Flp pilus assembly protein TadG